MKIKTTWQNNDFDNMDWHDSAIYSISLPQNNQILRLDIDYIFQWILKKDTNLFEFSISPSTLIFFDVLYLNIQIDFKDSVCINIREIKRINPHKSPNGEIILWTFIIETDKGLISFISSGFEQVANKDAIISNNISLGRD